MRTFGRYVLLEHLASGGMADVYLAESPGAGGFRKQIAIKIVLPAFAGGADASAFLKMFMEEARLASRLNHANIVQVFDFDQVDGQYYIAMEYVRGRTLLQILETGVTRKIRISVPCAVHICSQVATALAYAHRLTDDEGTSIGLVHRDVSPQNVMVSFEGEVKLTDFGIAHARDSRTGTAPGMVKGKAAYMAPEQALARPLDGRADVFALGTVLWELLTGSQPFLRDTDTATLLAVVGPEPTIPPPSSYNPDIPPELDAVVMRSLERDPTRRTNSADELARELSSIVWRLAKSPDDTDLRQLMASLWPDDAVPRPKTPTSRKAAVPDLAAAPAADASKRFPKTQLFSNTGPGQPAPPSAQTASPPPRAESKARSRPASSARPDPEPTPEEPPRRRGLGSTFAVVGVLLMALGSAAFFTRGLWSPGRPALAVATTPQAAEPRPAAEPDQPKSPPPGSLHRDDAPDGQVAAAAPGTAPAPVPTPAQPAQAALPAPPAPQPAPVPPAVVHPANPRPIHAAADPDPKVPPVAQQPHKKPKPTKIAAAQSVASEQDDSGQGRLQVLSDPWSIIFVDGKKVGYTPVDMMLPTGKHRLRAERDGFAPAEQMLTIRSGEQGHWSPRLRPAGQ